MDRNYFPGYTPQVVDDCAVPADQRPTQVDPHELPFVQLGGRRFEFLCCRLKGALFPERTVALMQGSGDGGRDIVLYEHGRVVEVVQCKNIRDRLSIGKLVVELTKLALHHIARNEILTAGIRYEIWCPAGLSGDAAELINTWPTRWTESAVRAAAKKLLSTPAFSKLRWEHIRERVLGEFPSVIVPRSLDALQITELVRSHSGIEADFFRVNRVVNVADVAELLKQGNFFQLKSEDVRYITQRLESFPEAARVHLLGTSLFGVTPAAMAMLTHEELEQLVRATHGAVHKCTEIIIVVAQRRAKGLIEQSDWRDGTFRMAIGWLLMTRIHCAVSGWTDVAPNRHLQAHYLESPIQEQLDTIVDELWRLLSSANTQGDRVSADSHTLRKQYPTKEVLREQLQGQLAAERNAVQSIIKEVDAVIPSSLCLVAEPMRLRETGTLQRFVTSALSIEAGKR